MRERKEKIESLPYISSEELQQTTDKYEGKFLWKKLFKIGERRGVRPTHLVYFALSASRRGLTENDLEKGLPTIALLLELTDGGKAQNTRDLVLETLRLNRKALSSLSSSRNSDPTITQWYLQRLAEIDETLTLLNEFFPTAFGELHERFLGK